MSAYPAIPLENPLKLVGVYAFNETGEPYLTKTCRLAVAIALCRREADKLIYSLKFPPGRTPEEMPPPQPQPKRTYTTKPNNNPACPHCGSPSIKDGWVPTFRKVRVQQYSCKQCHQKFRLPTKKLAEVINAN